MRKPPFALIVGAAMVFFSIRPSSAASELKEDLAALQGKWKGTVLTEQGTNIWTLENKGNKTLFSIHKDADLLFSASGEFKLEQAGPFKSFTYFNLEVKAGPTAGEKHLTRGETRSSAYKLQDGQLFTVGGLSKGDDTEPRLIRWTKSP